MATDRLINQTQGEDIIDQLQDIATKVGAITYGPQTTSDKVVAMTGYAKASTEAVISEGDTLNEAVGKLEKKADDALAGLGTKVVGPESSTTGAIATYSNATGNALANSGVTIATSTQGVTDSDTAVPTSKAVRAYNASTEHTYAFDTGTDNGTIKVTPSVGGTAGTAQSVAVKGLAGAAYKGVDTAPTASSANLVESGGVYTALGNKLDATANAASAAKLNNGSSDYSVGSATKGVYFDDGIPKAMTYSVESNVPQNAVFTDTTYTNGTGITIGSGNAINHSNSVTAVTTAGAYKVKYDAQGHITGTATLSASDISAVPTSRTVNSKALNSNITLAGSDIALTGYSKASSASAVAATDTVNQAIGKLEKDLDGYVPTTRTVNSKALSSNITLAGSDIALTGYAKGSSTAAVVATDTTNSAIAKHENRIDTNRANILYSLNTGVKNLISYDIDSLPTLSISNKGWTWNGNKATLNGLTLTFNVDGTINAVSNGATTGETRLYLYNFETVPISLFKISGVNRYCIFGNLGSSNLGIRFSVRNSSETLIAYDLDDTEAPTSFDITEARVDLPVAVWLYFPSGITINRVLKPMICLSSVYEQDSSFTPGAKPNYDLTRLQAEDRAALAEEIDAGAKNKLNWASATDLGYSNCTYSKTDTSLIASAGSSAAESRVFYSVGTFAAGNYVFKFKISSATISQQAIIYISTSTQASTSIASIQITANGEYELPFSWSGGTVYLKFYPNTTNTSSSNTFTVSNMMICTKAAFGVSSKFVPYRLNYDLVCQNIKDVNTVLEAVL